MFRLDQNFHLQGLQFMDTAQLQKRTQVSSEDQVLLQGFNATNKIDFESQRQIEMCSTGQKPGHLSILGMLL